MTFPLLGSATIGHSLPFLVHQRTYLGCKLLELSPTPLFHLYLYNNKQSWPMTIHFPEGGSTTWKLSMFEALHF